MIGTLKALTIIGEGDTVLEFIIILKEIILPIFIIMGIGYILQKRFDLDVQTLARLNIYFLVPGFIFVRLYETNIVLNMFLQIILFIIVYVFILYIIGIIVTKVIRLKNGQNITFVNSLVFFNSGNYGVPVNDLVFKSDPFAASIQVIVLMFQNIFIYSYGIFSMQAASKGRLQALLSYFKMPVTYALISGLVLGAYNIPIPQFIWVPANYIADSMIALSLLTLGAQVAKLKFSFNMSSVYLSVIIRLCIGPIIAFGMILITGMTGIVAQALLIASAMPTSINSAVIAQEYRNHPDMAAQIVLFSTLVSAFTVTFFIYFARIMFG